MNHNQKTKELKEPFCGECDHWHNPKEKCGRGSCEVCTPKKEFWLDRLADKIPNWLIIAMSISATVGVAGAGWLIFHP